MSRDPGFYWIKVDGLAPEVAFWDSQVKGWVLTGSEDAIDDEHPAKVVVLAGPLRPPIG